MTQLSGNETLTDVVAGSAALIPLLRQNAGTTEKARRLAPGNIDALAEAGVFKMTVQRRFGGYEADLTTQNAVMENLARGCGSTAWVSTVCTACTWFVGLFPDETQDEIFDAPDVRVAGVLAAAATATRQDGGYVVNGRWPFNTGCLDAHWAALTVPLGSGDDPEPALALMPYAELEILDDWYVTGLAGTGSNTVVANEVFVPDHRLLPIDRAAREDYLSERNADSPLFRYALAPYLVAGSTSTAIGLAREAMDVFVERASRRAITYTTYARQSDAPIAHQQLGEAALKVEAATLLRDNVSAPVMEGRPSGASSGRSASGSTSEPVRRTPCGWRRRPCRSCSTGAARPRYERTLRCSDWRATRRPSRSTRSSCPRRTSSSSAGRSRPRAQLVPL